MLKYRTGPQEVYNLVDDGEEYINLSKVTDSLKELLFKLLLPFILLFPILCILFSVYTVGNSLLTS